jgi:hypothetical protein
VPGGSGGGIPGNGGWTGLAFGRFFVGRGLAIWARESVARSVGLKRELQVPHPFRKSHDCLAGSPSTDRESQHPLLCQR